MSSPATIATLPGLLRAAREAVEAHAPSDGLAGLWRPIVATWIFAAELAAEQLVAAIPDAATARPRARQEQQAFYAPLGDRPPVIEEPRAPHRGHDLRLPGKRPHP